MIIFKYTDEKLIDELQRFNVSLLKKDDLKNIHIIDTQGYKYKASLYKMRTSQALPHKFKRNPYAIENIETYLSEIKSPLILLSSEYHNCKEKLQFKCRIHNDKIQYKTLDDLISQQGSCKYCAFEKRGENCQISEHVIIDRCTDLDLVYIDRFTKNKGTYIRFECPKHKNKGIQEIAWYHLKHSVHGCSYCAGKHKSTEDYVNEILQLMPEITILGEYTGSEQPISCQCKICGHIWSPIARSIKNKEGCPACKMSRGERKIRQYLIDRDIAFEYQKTFEECKDRTTLPFDFYIDSFQLAIEYDGEQHFRPVDFAGKGQEWAQNQFRRNHYHDQIKNQYCTEHNISLLRIPYYKYDMIENILDQKLNNAS